ncbi:RNA recognition motif domain [Lasallia pustulata]|uniref:RNA recognition motif domain n=1 Tax=Lasallia pustulata TaxID=136370 RepID=A0A1W5CRW9_9LECA|nr:RNA recognition motif domain [Lasallia pustulata]
MSPLLDANAETQKPRKSKSKRLREPSDTSPNDREMSEEPTTPTDAQYTSVSPSRKRRRVDKLVEEIEVDVSAPEPPSKKALRKAKKGQSTRTDTDLKTAEKASATESQTATTEQLGSTKRSEYGIWIGNLPWTATKVELCKFLTDHTDITEEMITRIHMPTSTEAAGGASRQRVKPLNKGFAYVDFSTAAALAEAVALSETLFTGRRVLIKDSKSFEGRPEKPSEDAAQSVKSGKPPNNRIFVGNLTFETTKEDLQDNFERCGEIQDIHVATFEDSGKCKGYAWVEFKNVEAAQAAVRGWVKVGEQPDSGSEDENEDRQDKNGRLKKRPKERKWWVNRIKGRDLRIEFAEEKAVRYKKRFGKDGTAKELNAGGEDLPTAVIDSTDGGSNSLADPEMVNGAARDVRRGNGKPGTLGKSQRKVDARSIKPGAALAGAQRLTGAIVASTGKKTTFDGK